MEEAWNMTEVAERSREVLSLTFTMEGEGSRACFVAANNLHYGRGRV